MPPCLTLSNKGWIGGKALRHTDVMSRGCTCTLSRLTSLETGDRLLPYGSGTLHLPGLEIDRPETRLKDYLSILPVFSVRRIGRFRILWNYMWLALTKWVTLSRKHILRYVYHPKEDIISFPTVPISSMYPKYWTSYGWLLKLKMNESQCKL